MKPTYNKQEIFSELRDRIYSGYQNDPIDMIRISSLENSKEIIEKIKTLKVIELNSLESFFSYMHYDHFLIFKFKDEYYFCDTLLFQSLGLKCMIKVSDFNQFFRKDKITKINKI